MNEGHLDVVQALLDAGADVRSKDLDGWSILHVACYYGQPEIVDMVLRHGGQVIWGIVCSVDKIMCVRCIILQTECMLNRVIDNFYGTPEQA